MTIDPPADQLKRISDKVAADAAKIDTFQYKAAAERSQFFEKLALSNGSAIVVSVTFIGYFFPKQDLIKTRWLLHGSWCLLLLSNLASESSIQKPKMWPRSLLQVVYRLARSRDRVFPMRLGPELLLLLNDRE